MTDLLDAFVEAIFGRPRRHALTDDELRLRFDRIRADADRWRARMDRRLDQRLWPWPCCDDKRRNRP